MTTKIQKYSQYRNAELQCREEEEMFIERGYAWDMIDKNVISRRLLLTFRLLSMVHEKPSTMHT